MKLFKINGDSGQLPIFVFARGHVHACSMYITWEMLHETESEGFDVVEETMATRQGTEAEHLREALLADLAGFGTYTKARWS